MSSALPTLNTTTEVRPLSKRQQWLPTAPASAMRNPVLPSPTEAEAEKYIKDFLRLAPGRV
ncbi:hypothetical protein DPX16_0213 [Anabarilius grahami]|uniref:Uncharacterized protein n=1 Tax=Anabarilius grahami TaxID=495550 RepID=A0A3N0Y5Z4_ANAGA|nr:hypothetical protein DPX16_0213 [Anabarilius grahami]